MCYFYLVNLFFMKINVILSFIFFLFIGCSKVETSTISSEEVFNISFSTNFTQSLIPRAKLASTSAKKPVDSLELHLNLLIYDNNGRLVRNEKQRNWYYEEGLNWAIDENFGKFSIQLPQGVYSIGASIHCIGEGDLDVSSTNEQQNSFRISFSNLHESRTGIRDAQLFTFPFKKITVNKDSVYEPLILQRRNSNLTLEIVDSIPAKVGYMLVGSNFSNLIYLFDQNPIDRPLSSMAYFHNDVRLLSGKSHTIHSFDILPTSVLGTTYDLNVIFLDIRFNFLGEKKINGVLLKPKYITYLKGKLFDGLSTNISNNMEVEAKIESDYESEKIEISF